jgi:hypothetical protein
MQVRWALALALWTLLVGPVLNGSGSRSPGPVEPTPAAANRARHVAPAHAPKPSTPDQSAERVIPASCVVPDQ